MGASNTIISAYALTRPMSELGEIDGWVASIRSVGELGKRSMGESNTIVSAYTVYRHSQ